MKRLAVFVSVGLALLALAGPADANFVPSIQIDCDSVDVQWARFPERDVILTVTVSQGDEKTLATVNTDGEPNGEASVPVDLESGEASAVVRWRLRESHQAGPVTADLTCTPTTTSVPPTATTEPTTTTALTGTSNSIPVTSATPTSAPGLPDTGSGASLWALGIGAYAVAFGSIFMALNRRGTR